MYKSPAQIEREAEAMCAVDDSLTMEEARELAGPRRPTKIYSWEELHDMPNPGWLIGDAEHPVLIADGLWMDVGPQKSGKTYAALEKAFCIAFGITYYGLPVKQGNVCYVIAEGGVQRIFLRLCALRWKYKDHLERMGITRMREVLNCGRFNLVGTAVNLSDVGAARIGAAELIKDMGDRPYVAVWFDTWGRMLAAAGGHAMEADVVVSSLRGCDLVRDRLDGCTVCLVAHCPINDDGRPKGLGEQQANIDGMTLCLKIDKGRIELFTNTSAEQRHGKEGFALTFEQKVMVPDRVFVDAGGDFSDTRLDDMPLEKAALDVLRKMEPGQSLDDWRDALFETAGWTVDKDDPKRKSKLSMRRNRWHDVKKTLEQIGAIEVNHTMVTARSPKAE